VTSDFRHRIEQGIASTLKSGKVEKWKSGKVSPFAPISTENVENRTPKRSET
jgi:hypothetical protein